MKRYSIKDLELLTGIKSHTLRIWESRYNIIKPKRTDTNIRYYLDDDLKKILNVVQLNRAGYKISKIANMSSAERRNLILETAEDINNTNCQIQQLSKAMFEFDENRFNHIVSSATLKMGFENCMLKIVYPFLEQTGKLWQTSSICVAQEHFITNLIRQKIIAAIDGQIPKDPAHTRRGWLFCPPRERHELGLLFANYLLRKQEMHTLYLGADLPMCDWSEVINNYKPDFFVIAVTAGYAKQDQNQFIKNIQKKLNHIPGFIIGKEAENWKEKLPKNLTIVEHIDEIKRIANQF